MAHANWALDKAHSHVGFSVRHMMISNVRGNFENFDATVSADTSDLSTAAISVTIDPTSINTGNADRDNHLKSADFFKAEEHPHIKFESTKLTYHGGEEHKLEGHLTLLGTQKPITLNCEITGPAKDPWGNDRIGVVATGSINRNDFGLSYNSVLEAGGVLIGETVKLNVEVEFVKQA